MTIYQNHILDPATGLVYDGKGQKLPFRWLELPGAIHPDELGTVTKAVKEVIGSRSEVHAYYRVGTTGHELVITHEGKEGEATFLLGLELFNACGGTGAPLDNFKKALGDYLTRI